MSFLSLQGDQRAPALLSLPASRACTAPGFACSRRRSRGTELPRDAAEAEEPEEEEPPTSKKVTVPESDWEQLNTQNAIWLREPSDISELEYEKFYQAISKVPPPSRRKPSKLLEGGRCKIRGRSPSILSLCARHSQAPMQRKL